MGVLLLMTGCVVLVAGMGIMDGGGFMPGIGIAVTGLGVMGLGAMLERWRCG